MDNRVIDSRREFTKIAGFSIASGVVGYTSHDFISSVLDERFSPRISGSFRSTESMVQRGSENTAPDYPYRYSLLATSKADSKKILWERLGENAPNVRADIRNISYSDQFLVLHGLSLPESKMLDSVQPEMRGSTLQLEYRVVDRRSDGGSQESSIDNRYEIWDSEQIAPSDVDIRYSFSAE